jgi:hypothetical protein
MYLTLIGGPNLGINMADNSNDPDAFTTIRIRRFDHERLMNLRRVDESHWEVLRRLLDKNQLRGE